MSIDIVFSNKWIDSTKSLPEDGQHVLVVFVRNISGKDFEMCTAEFFKEDGFFSREFNINGWSPFWMPFSNKGYVDG